MTPTNFRIATILAWAKPELKIEAEKYSTCKQQTVIPKGGVCPRNLLFLGNGAEKRIPRFARDGKSTFSAG
jgi:hypothetical protein